jgi:hypothetical protein
MLDLAMDDVGFWFGMLDVGFGNEFGFGNGFGYG